MSSPMVLRWPLDNVELHLKTGASETGYGGILYQINPETNKLHIIQLFSGGFKNAQDKG